MAKRYDSTMRNVLAGLLCMVGLLVVAPTDGLAQQGLPEFEVDAVSMRGSDGLTRLELYTRIPYAHLSFINTSTGFTATYEVAVDVHELDARNRPGALVLSRRWESNAVVNAFFLTQATGNFDHTTHQLELQPGRYQLTFQLTDQNAHEVYVREMLVEARDMNRPVALSDLLLIEEYDEARKTIFPRVSDRVPSDQFVFQMFYETYLDQGRRLNVTREIWPLRKRSSAFIRAGRTLLGLGNDEIAEKPIYTSTETVSFKAGKHQAVSQMPLDEIAVGDYLVRVRLTDEHGAVFAETERTFSATWSGLADHLSNLDEAIEQLRYIAKKKELESIKKTDSFNERLRRFQSFWTKRDPTPGTLRNENMEEYYYRIDYANKHYGSVIPGWKTDRGEVLVNLGRPDFVEKHLHDYNTEPYEIWWYYRIGRRFVFIDKTGFGDFESFYPLWDDRNRIR